jgi:hypothetical protein
MQIQNSVSLIQGNQFSADAACAHCDGIMAHEPWCITQNARVQYAYQLINESAHLSRGDELILHALGATWTAKKTGLNGCQ